MSITITSKCGARECDGQIVFTRASADDPVVGRCPVCETDWHLRYGELHRLTPGHDPGAPTND